MADWTIHPDWEPVGDGTAFNRFTMEIRTFSGDAADSLDAVAAGEPLPDGGVEQLAAANVVTDEDDPDSQLPEFERRAGRADDVRINRMRFFVTERCNMGCPGCFVRFKYRNDMDFENADREKARKAVDFLREQNEGESFTIQFLGGEPLVALELIKYTIDYAKEVCETTEPNFSLTTNATLVTDDIANYLDEEDVRVGVSFDGWKEINDESRVYMSGEGTYEDAVEGYWTLKEHVSQGVGILITPQPANADVLDEVVEQLVDELDPDGVTINDPFHSDGEWEINGRQFAENVKRILAFCEKHRIPVISPASQIIKAVSQEQPKLQTLTKPERLFSVALSVDGRITYHIMNYDEALFPNDIDDWSTDRFEEWATMSGYRHEKCRNCVALNTCAGPDPIESYQGNHDIDDVQLNPERCKFYKHMTRWFVRQYA